MTSEETIELRILSYEIPADQLRVMLGEYLAELSDAPLLSLENEPSRFRAPEPTIIVALVSGAGVALGTLLGGLLKIAERSKNQKIVIHSKSGAKLEVPADTPLERIDELVERLRGLDEPRILL